MKKFIKIFLILLTLISLSGYFTLKFIVRPRKMADEGMLPTFKKGEYIWAEKVSYEFTNPRRGDIVIYVKPEAIDKNDFWEQRIGRIVGLPEETVEIKEGKIFIDDVELQEDYIKKGKDVYTPYSMFLGRKIRLEKDNYIILSDDRVRGRDSRSLGPIPRLNIIGRVFIW